ncbi:LysE family translocator [Promicromonospora sp. Populi]|uniref:LysE family translocator n=1 Tax=Promicromonospora sp. Populi TaxID=3239420 RepID=UPI0034E237CA
MVSTENLLAFAAVALLMVAVPGPSVMFTIGRSISLGRTGGFLSILGIAAGSTPLAIAVALGVGAVIAQSVVIFTAVKIVGALYLVYLGVQAIRHRADGGPDAADPSPARSGRRLLGEGFVVGVTNPKTVAFFVAVLPQFVDPQAGSVPLQLLQLGLVVVCVGLVSDSAWVIASSAARDWFGRSPRRLSAMSATGGGLMIGLGGSLLLWGEQPPTR